MSLTTATNSLKQRKLTDLRVIDLQRELRSFGIPYDKKELKVSLVEKLRQALLYRNFDPDLHLFDTSTDLKSVLSDENNRSHEENGSQERNNSEASNVEIDSEERLNIENSVQTMAASSTRDFTTTTASLAIEMGDESYDQTDGMDTIDLGQIVEDRDDDNLILTIDETTSKKEDENNNDKMDHGLTHGSCSSEDDELDTNNSTEQSTNTNNHLFDHKTSSLIITTTENDQQTVSDHPHHTEDTQHTTTTTERTTDDATLSKSDINRSPQSTDDQQKQENNNKFNKNQCHLWVSNIAKETHASDLKELFSKHGKVLTTKVIGSSSSQWFGYINLATPDDVERCINVLHQTELHGEKIYVDREMHDQISSSSTSKSKTNSSSTSHRHISSRESSSSSSNHTRRSDHSNHKSSPNTAFARQDSASDLKDKSASIDTDVSSKNRSASTSNETKKKLSTFDINKSNKQDKTTKSHDSDESSKKSTEKNGEKRRTLSSSSQDQPSRHRVTRTDLPKANDKSESLRSSQKATPNDRKHEKQPKRSDSSSTHSADVSRFKTSSAVSHRSRSTEKRFMPPSANSNHHSASSLDKSKQQLSSHTLANKYDKTKELPSKDYHRSTPSNTFETDRRSMHHSEQRLRHEKELFERKQFVQQQEEEKIKGQQRRLAEERERMKRDFEILERERLEIERTRIALEKEKQDQARELEKQQRRLADEAKHRQQQLEAKLRDEKLQRLAHNNDNKRPRASHHESQRSHHSNKTYNSSHSSSYKEYGHRSPTNTSSGHGRNRSLDDTDRDYYPEPKRQYTNNANNQRETIFRDRAVYRDSDLPISSSSIGIASSSSSIASGNSSQRYISSSSNQHRVPDPYGSLPPRGRDMALPPSSSVSTAYERSTRTVASSPTNASSIPRRAHSRERFDNREYLQETERRDRSPSTSNKLRREPLETTHWERPKPRDTAHYASETHKYLPNQYLSESSSQSIQQQQQQQHQQGLWSSVPPSRQQQQQQQQHRHPDLSIKHPYGWQLLSQQTPPQPLSSHDRSRANLPNNQRIPMLPSNQPPPPPPPPSSRGSTAGQTHLYSHPGVPVSSLSSSQQQHVQLAPPPPSLHHTPAYLTQQVPPTGLVLHSTGQTRTYEPHYVVSQPLPPQRRY